MVTQSKRLYHVDHSTTCFFQVEDLFITPVLVVVQLLDGMELLGDLLISLLQLLLYGLFVLSKIGIEPTKFCTIPKSLSLSLLCMFCNKFHAVSKIVKPKGKKQHKICAKY